MYTTNIESVPADAYAAGGILYPDLFSDLDLPAKAGLRRFEKEFWRTRVAREPFLPASKSLNSGLNASRISKEAGNREGRNGQKRFF